MLRKIFRRFRSPTLPVIKDKVVVISGASSGIGEELTLLFAAQGAKVVLSARRVDCLEAVAAKCKSRGAQNIQVVQCDVSKELDCKNLIDKTVERFGGVDILVLNAGIGQVGHHILSVDSFTHCLFV